MAEPKVGPMRDTQQPLHRYKIALQKVPYHVLVTAVPCK